MFYTHSALVERAGKIESNHAAQTILPIVYSPGGDITAYLPTNVMSMTDGQWILDSKIFKDTMRPAISTGLSVTRVGGVGHNKRQKELTDKLNKTLSGFRVAEEYAHFGTELSPESQADFDKGKVLFKLMNQSIGEVYSFAEQQFLMDVVLGSTPEEIVDIEALKKKVHDYAPRLEEDDKLEGNFADLSASLKAEVTTIDEKKAAEIAKAKKIEEEKKRQAEEAARAMQASESAGAGAAEPTPEPEKAAKEDKDKK
jgi:F-type H+-transporting ATPase subunit alpha